MPHTEFLSQREARPFTLTDSQELRAKSLFLGAGASALEVALVEAQRKPSVAELRSAWKARLAGRATPLLLVAAYDGRAAVIGPSGDQPTAYLDVEPDKLERICAAALDEPDRHAALRFLNAALPELESATAGLRNEGLFATYELEKGLPNRADWNTAADAAKPLLRLRERELLSALGFTVEQLQGPAYVLRAAETRTALAILLDRKEAPEVANARFSHLSPISYALAKAEDENLDYVIVLAGPLVRLYPVRTGVGTGQRGRTETFAEVRLDLLSAEQAAYLWLLFSAAALKHGGTVHEILQSSREHAAELGRRLRERIYDEVIPPLAEGVMEARNLKKPSADDLAQTYQMALVILFRLLFIAYAEDKALLPYNTNEFYRDRSLKKKAMDLTRLRREQYRFDQNTTTHWEEIERLFRAVDEGHREWGVPRYNGGLFSSDSAVSPIGTEITKLKLPDRIFGEVLSALLVDRTREGWGPVDFRSLGVREFGTVYEGLLENELSIAEADLSTEVREKKELYRPAKPGEEIQVAKGKAFLHNTSGARKSSGSYFTKDFAVDHLLNQGLEPALKEHLERLDAMSEREAGESLFDFRVADITMGSGHFLVAAVDRIERAFSTYLAKRRLPEITDELHRLRESALDALRESSGDIEIEDGQLLRRQIARRCIYGVDLNPIAVELARLALWIHTFVPGLPLSFLDHNLAPGNSLVGIATLEEASKELQELLELPIFRAEAGKLLGPASAALTKLARLSDANAAEIKAAREAAAEARQQVAPAAALFDVLTAARIDEEVRKDFAQHGTFWLDSPGKALNSPAHKSALKVLAPIPAFHFPVAFPEVFLRERAGFDLIIGNPPWEEATVEEDRFWTRHRPGFHSLKQKDQELLKRELRTDRRDLVKLLEAEIEHAELLRRLLVRSPYPGMGTGDPDTYKAACWRFWALVRDDTGRVSVVLPRSAFAAKGSADFRRQLLRSCQFQDVTWLVNRLNWVFPDVHPQYTFVLSSWVKRAPPPDGTFPLRGPYSSEARFLSGVSKSSFQFPVRDVLSWTDTAALPLLPSDDSVSVFAQLRLAPRLDLDRENNWSARPYRELDATNDKSMMTLTTERPEGYWPVFKGESFDLWQPDTGKYYAWADPGSVTMELQKTRLRSSRVKGSLFSEFPKQFLENSKTLPCYSPRVAFRDVTRATDTRTVRVAMLPGKVFLTNSAPCLIWVRGDEKDESYLLGIMSSICLDWYARRFVEIHMNYHVLNPFPVPRPDRTNPLWIRTVSLAGRLASPDRRFASWATKIGVEYGALDPDEKQDMIHELDAVVAHLYGLYEPHLRHIFETFHEGWDYAERLDATLVHYRAWQKKL